MTTPARVRGSDTGRQLQDDERPLHNPVREGLPTNRLLLRAKEGVNLFAKSVGAFEVREMSAAFQSNHACIWNCLRDVLSRTSGDEVVIAVDDQRRDLEPLELGEQVILGF